MLKVLLRIGGYILIFLGVMTPISTTIITFFLPETYASTARILPGVKEPYALTTEVEKIQSEAILKQVVTNLNLNKFWTEKFKEVTPLSPEIAYVILKNHIEIRRARNTLIIQVTAYSEDCEQAAAIANEIVKVYQSSPMAVKTSDGKPALQIIEKAKPEFKPRRPNKQLNIAMGCGLGVIITGLGIALLLLGRRSSAPPRLQASVAGP